MCFLCDTSTKTANALKRDFSLAAPVTDKLADLAGNVTAALVATPPRYHMANTVDLLQMGIDVLCEKPLANNFSEAAQMVDVADQAGRILGVGLVTRYYKQNRLLRQLLQESRIGPVKEIIAEFGAPLDWPMASDSYYKNAQGGVFFDMGIHFVDRVAWLFGGINVTEFWDDSYGGVEANALLHGNITLAGGQVACDMRFSWTHHLRNSIRIVGGNGTLEVRMREPNIVRFNPDTKAAAPSLLIQQDLPRIDPYTEQLIDFRDSVRLRRPTLAAASSALPGLQIIEQAYSIRQHWPQPWVEPDTKG